MYWEEKMLQQREDEGFESVRVWGSHSKEKHANPGKRCFWGGVVDWWVWVGGGVGGCWGGFGYA